jgi:mono/diheme cytochrome c family protein
MRGIRLLLLEIGGTLALTAGATLADTAPDTAASDDAAKLGAQVFQSNGCGYCHENGGKSAGKGPQLMETARSDDFITFRVKHGKEGRMPAFGGSISDAQIVDVIAYIRGLKN